MNILHLVGRLGRKMHTNKCCELTHLTMRHAGILDVKDKNSTFLKQHTKLYTLQWPQLPTRSLTRVVWFTMYIDIYGMFCVNIVSIFISSSLLSTFLDFHPVTLRLTYIALLHSKVCITFFLHCGL